MTAAARTVWCPVPDVVDDLRDARSPARSGATVTGSAVRGAAAGADEEFTAEFASLHVVAHRVAFRILGDRAEAADVAQEALTRAFTRWWSIREHAPRWVVRVATNLSLDVVRRRARRDLRADVPDVAAASDPWVVVRLDLQRALRRLPRRQREVVVLRYLADRSEVETADLLGLRVGTVRQHTTRALKTLRVDHQLMTGAEREG